MENNNINSSASIEVTGNGSESIHIDKSFGKEYINIPIELIKYAIMNKIINQLKVLICLKDLTSGQFILNQNSIKQFSDRIDVNSKTLRKHIKWLLDKKWIVLNRKSGSHRVISFKQISSKLKHSSKSGALFYTTDYKKFRGFVYAAFITYCMKYLKRYNNKKNWDLAKPERKKERSNSSLAPNFYYLPHLYLAKVLETSKANAAKYRNTAIRDGFITAKKNFSKLNLEIDQLDSFKKYFCNTEKVEIGHVGLSKEQKLEPQKVVKRRNGAYMQQPDFICSKVMLRTKGNLKVRKKATPIKKRL